MNDDKSKKLIVIKFLLKFVGGCYLVSVVLDWGDANIYKFSQDFSIALFFLFYPFTSEILFKEVRSIKDITSTKISVDVYTWFILTVSGVLFFLGTVGLVFDQ